MKFELKFDTQIYNKQMDLLFELVWQKKKVYYRNSQYFGFFLLIIVIIILIFDKPSLFSLAIIVFSLGILIPYYYYFFKIKSDFKKLEIIKTSEIKKVNEQNSTFWEFTEKSLILENSEDLRELNWKEFLIYIIKEDNLVMFTKDYEPFILSEIEVGKDNFKKIIDFISKKISN